MRPVTDRSWLDATDLAALVRSGEVSPVELVDEAVTRIEALNPALNAVVWERFAEARAEAGGPLPDGPFRGVPFLVKDLTIKVAGQPFHQGSSLLKARDHRAEIDSHLWERFRGAGFVLLGGTNTPELGSTITTEPRAHGPAHNPWNLDHSTGGSSGGTGAAVASGMVPVAHANDGGGSIRIPASECGVVGLKPSRPRQPRPRHRLGVGAATIDGVLSRSVRDTASVLDAISGYEPGDPLVAPVPARPFREEVGREPGRLRIGFVATPMPGAELHPECVAAVEGALRLLESLGHEVVDGQPSSLFDEAFVPHFVNLVAAATAEDVAIMEAIAGRPSRATTWRRGTWRSR